MGRKSYNRGYATPAIFRTVIAGFEASERGVDHGGGRVVAAENHEQIADHGSTPVVVELDDVVFFETGQRHLNHRHGSFDNLLAGADYCRCLLSAQHDGGNLRSIGEVVEACFENFDADHGKAFVEFRLELFIYLSASAAQCQLLVAGAVLFVVGIAAGDLAQGGVALDCYKALGRLAVACVEVKTNTVGVFHAPYEHHADKNGVADLVVDLYGGDVEVVDAQRNLARCQEGIEPVESGARHRAAVFAEEKQYNRLIRFEHNEAAQADERHNTENYSGDYHGTFEHKGAGCRREKNQYKQQCCESVDSQSSVGDLIFQVVIHKREILYFLANIMKKGNTRKPFQKIACLRSRFQKLTNKTNYFFMKRVLLILAVVFGCTAVFAQKLDKNEARQLKAFLAAPAAEATTNAAALGVADVNAFASLEGVTVENGHVTVLNLKEKKLGGTLDLSGFTALTSVDVSRNSLTTLNVSGCNALKEVNASRNRLKEASFDGCDQLTKILVYRNRLTEFNVSQLPMIQTINVSNNYLVSLNVAGSSTLKTLNCQGNHLESLTIDGCTGLKNLYCGYNKLTAINLFGVENLQNLNVDDNQISSMLVSGLPSLSSFVCSDNNMTTLGLRNCDNLLDLVCSYNNLTQLNVENCRNLLFVDCSYNDLTQLILSNQSFLQRVLCNNNQLQILDLSFDPALTYINCRFNYITDLRTIGDDNLGMIACQWNP